jgi:fatty acid-binding protein DegV
MTVTVVTDSAACLPEQELVSGIVVVPFNITIDG